MRKSLESSRFHDNWVIISRFSKFFLLLCFASMTIGQNPGTLVNEYFGASSINPSITTLYNNDYVITWESIRTGNLSVINAAYFFNNGSKRNVDLNVSAVGLNASLPNIAPSVNGFIIGFSYNSSNFAYSSIVARRYDLTNGVGLVSDIIASETSGGLLQNATVFGFANSEVMVVWGL